MAVAQSKNPSEIKKLIFDSPIDWIGFKDDSASGFQGYKNNATTPKGVTVKWKDGSADQTHTIPAGGTVLFGGGFVHFSA